MNSAGQLLDERHAPRIPGRDDLGQLRTGAHAARVDLGARRGPRRAPPRGRADEAIRVAQRVHDVACVGWIDDTELGRQRERLGVRTDDAVRDCVESAAEDALGRAAVRRLRPGEHVVRGPPREGKQQDAARLHALLTQPGGARDERASLPGAGAGEYQQRAALMRSSTPLVIIENIQNARLLRHGH